MIEQHQPLAQVVSCNLAVNKQLCVWLWTLELLNKFVKFVVRSGGC